MLAPSTSQAPLRSDSSACGNLRFSAWFHGHSIIGADRSRPFHRAPKTCQNRRRSEFRNGSGDLTSISGLRSPSSTRSIIDPTSSPNLGSDPATTDVLNRIHTQAAVTIEGLRSVEERIMGVTGDTRTRTRLALSRPRKNPGAKKQRRRCYPEFRNRNVKRKAIGCLASGIMLAVILTICESTSHSTVFGLRLNNETDLALAISNSGNGETFHAILIMLILIVTIIFCHYLIRLCMLALRPKRHDSNSELVDQSRAGVIARPREPIRVILARDEELGLYETGVVEEDKEIAIPPPPPAYGSWRCSVVSIKHRLQGRVG